VNIAIDASCLLINPFSGLAEVVDNLLLNLPHVSKMERFTLFINYFRASKRIEDITYRTTNRFTCKIPRRLISYWWRRDWPTSDFCLPGVDIFHSFHIQLPPTRKIRRILTVHDCRFLALSELYETNQVNSYRKMMEKSLERAEIVVAVSNFTGAELQKYFSLPQDRIRIVYNGFNPDRASASQNHAKLQSFMVRNKLPGSYLLCAGAPDPRKNILRLIEAFSACRSQSADFPHLVVTGVSKKMWQRSIADKRSRELGISDYVHLCGSVDRDIYFGLIENAHALCYPSLYEGFGFPPLEAMAAGVPVLAANSSAIPEISGAAAYLVDPLRTEDIANGLNQIVYNDTLRRTLVQSGSERVRKFSWKKAAADYVGLYKEVFC
jgi:glycosyltransferase involved in cell wall biosynthesis